MFVLLFLVLHYNINHIINLIFILKNKYNINIIGRLKWHNNKLKIMIKNNKIFKFGITYIMLKNHY